MKPAHVFNVILWAASALCSAQTITVRVYDYASLPAGQWAKTAVDAGLILAKAGIAATWVACRGAELQPESASVCESELGPADYVVRILPGERNPKPGLKRALAHSQVEHFGGRYATLFVDATQAYAADLAVSQSILMAYVTAHEVLHLLRGPAHAKSGVMKEFWTRSDTVAISQLNLAVR